MQQLSLFSRLSFSVSELTYYIRQVFEADEILQDVWVTGEISNLSRPRSGHIYFTLKDENAALHCVIWKSAALRIRTVLNDGMAVEVHGSISVYERSGQYQLYVTTLREAGEGRLYQEFLRLKSVLEAEGLFDEERKRVLPKFPRIIGIVSSPTGAALQDMLNTLRGRFPLAEVVLSPAAVQGDAAPGEIVAAIDRLNQSVKPDVILLCRGGGSLEDLWAFNDERVVRAVVASVAPVVSGVGHETDFTLTDFAADLRAPTPTAAAVLATPDIAEMREDLQQIEAELDSTCRGLIEYSWDNIAQISNLLKQLSPKRRILNDRQHLDEIDLRISKTMLHRMQFQKTRLSGLSSRLESLAPEAVMKRGYAILSKTDGSLIKSVADTSPGEKIHIDMTDGQIDGRVETIKADKKQVKENQR